MHGTHAYKHWSPHEDRLSILKLVLRMYWSLITEICELHWSSQTHYSRHFQDGLLTSKQKQPDLTVTPTGQTNSFCLFPYILLGQFFDKL